MELQAHSGNDFALHLFRTRSFVSAITELERLIYYDPDDSFTPYAKYLLALSYAHTGERRRAVALLRELLEWFKTQDSIDKYETLFCESHLQLASLHFRERDFDDFEMAAYGYYAACPSTHPLIEGYMQNMTLAMHVYNRSWEEALHALHAASLLEEDVRAVIERGIGELIRHRPKRPVLGGVFSVVPGMGHLYAGRPADCIRSFLINAAGIGLTVFCFTMGLPVLGSLFGIITAVLYMAGVYGGINAVHQQNARYVLERRDELLRHLQMPPLNVILLWEELGLR
jgi:hypothetical protein